MNGEIKHIVWDWNGTLLDDLWLCLESINTLLTERNAKPIGRDHYRNIFKFPVREYYLEAGFDFSQEPFEIPARQFIELYDQRKKDCHLQPHAAEMIRFIHARKVQQFILSASESSVLEEMLTFHGLREFFTAVVGLDNHYADGKLALAHKLSNEHRLQPENTLLIGDTAHDQQVGDAVGWKTILYTGGHYATNRLTGGGAPLIYSLNELRALFQTE